MVWGAVGGERATGEVLAGGLWAGPSEAPWNCRENALPSAGEPRVETCGASRGDRAVGRTGVRAQTCLLGRDPAPPVGGAPGSFPSALLHLLLLTGKYIRDGEPWLLRGCRL